MMRYLGSIIGAGILGSVLSNQTGTPEVWLFRLIFGVLLVVAGLALASTFFIHRFPEREVSEEERMGLRLAEARASAATNV